MALAQTYHIGYDDRLPYSVCGAFQDDDSYCGPSRSLSPLGITERDWRDVANDADGVAVWPQPGDPNSVWNVGINELNGQLGIFDLTSRQNVDITPDVTDTNGAALAGRRYRFNWEAPLAFAPLEPGVAFFGANVLFRTADRGQTWSAISPDLTRNDPDKQQVAGGPINTDVSGAEYYDTLLDIAPSPVDAKHDLDRNRRRPAATHHRWRIDLEERHPAQRFGLGSRRMHRAVARIVGARVRGRESPRVRRPHTVHLGYRRRRRDLDDRSPAGLPPREPAHVVREDPRNANVLYAGLEQGAWVSFDRGAHWQSLRLGMPSTSVRDLRVQPRANDLIAGTHGRGLWILDDLTPLQDLTQALATTDPTLFAPPPAHAWYLWWAGQYGTGDTECCVPAGAFSGTDPVAWRSAIVLSSARFQPGCVL